MSATRRKILDTARALFNEHGLHRVGVRDIARAIRISPGNLAYHFPTKDDLVSALLLELHELNGRTVFGELPATFSLLGVYRAAVGTMRNILGFRFVLLSYFDAVTASPELRRLETTLWIGRRRRFEAMTGLLVRNGYLERRAITARAEYLYDQAQIVSNGWLVAATLRPDLRDDETIVLHYAKVGCALLDGYCTPKGARQMQGILSGRYDETFAPPAVSASPAAKQK